MVFRIRFRRTGDNRESEAVVEANGPMEAMIKFRHIHASRPHPHLLNEQITSICSDCPDIEPMEEPLW